MDEHRLRQELASLPLAGLHYFDSVGSTNDQALILASQGAADRTLLVADQQTAGRGRAGRHWYSPAGAALAVSLILKPTGADRAATGRLAGLGALAVTDACSPLGLRSSIKWPNDVLIQDRKVAGVLVESAWNGNALEASVIGVGVNVLRTSVPDESLLAFPATCIESELGRAPDRIDLLRDLVRALLDWHNRIASDEFMQAWSERLAFRDKLVNVVRDAQPPVTGRVIGLQADGSLILEADGRMVTAQVGELHLRPTNDRIA